MSATRRSTKIAEPAQKMTQSAGEIGTKWRATDKSGRWLRRNQRMARFTKDAAVRQIQTLYTAGALGGLTDRELLEQFVAGNEAEAAFEVLVARHGPIVARHVPDASRRPSRSGRCVSGNVLGAGPPGRLDSQQGGGGELALRGRLADRNAGASGSHAQAHAVALSHRACPTRGEDRAATAPRGNTGALRGGRPAARALPGADRALLPGMPDPRAGRAGLALPGGDLTDPAIACQGKTTDAAGTTGTGADHRSVGRGDGRLRGRSRRGRFFTRRARGIDSTRGSPLRRGRRSGNQDDHPHDDSTRPQSLGLDAAETRGSASRPAWRRD